MLWDHWIFTAHIRRMREGNSFSLFRLVGGGGGSTPSQVWIGGIPSQVQTGGTPSQVQMGGGGYSIPGPDGRYPVLLMGGTPTKIRMGLTLGYPPHQQNGVPSHPDLGDGGGTLVNVTKKY